YIRVGRLTVAGAAPVAGGNARHVRPVSVRVAAAKLARVDRRLRILGSVAVTRRGRSCVTEILVPQPLDPSSRSGAEVLMAGIEPGVHDSDHDALARDAGGRVGRRRARPPLGRGRVGGGELR